MKRTLVVIVTYNGLKWIDRCLGSVVSYPSELVTAFVVDNGSTDGTVEHIRKAFPSVHLFVSEENLGFGRANNIGFRFALTHGYDYVYLLNQDAWVNADTIGSLVAAMKQNPQYGILSPVQMKASMTGLDGGFAEKCLTMSLEKYEEGHIYDVSFVMAAHWLVSRECLEKVGGFSPAFRHYGEDDNYLHRVRYKGLKIGFLSGAMAVHDREERLLTKTFRMRRKYIMSVAEISNPSNCLLLRLVLQPLKMVLWSVRWMSIDVLKYIPELISRYPELIKFRCDSYEDGAFL